MIQSIKGIPLHPFDKLCTLFTSNFMPTFILYTSVPDIDEEIETTLHHEVSEIISNVIGKSKDFIMTVFHAGVSIRFGQTDQLAAYCEFKNVGTLSSKVTDELSRLLCPLLTTKLDLNSKAIYIEFQESERHLWGWDSSTFA